MKKNKLLNFISKYSLNGNINSVRWNIKDKKIYSRFLLPNKSLIGFVVTNIEYDEDAELGIYETEKLYKMISILENDIEIKLTKTHDKFRTIEMNDSFTKIKYMLSELDIITKVTENTIKYLPNFNLKINLTDNTINKFLKAKNAIDLSEYFYINCDILNETCNFILGEGTNRISISVDSNSDVDIQSLSFSTELFSSILSVNKDFKTVKLEVSNEGLLHIEFTSDEFYCEYYLVARVGDEYES